MKRYIKIFLVGGFIVLVIAGIWFGFSSRSTSDMASPMPNTGYGGYLFALYDSYGKFGDFSGRPAVVDLASHPLGLAYKTRLIDTAKKGPNFSSHFTIVEWGCGTECQHFAVVDALSGKIFDGLTTEHGSDFRIDSNLLVVNPINWYDLGYISELPEWLTTKFYEWTGSEFVFLAEYRLGQSGMEPVSVENSDNQKFLVPSDGYTCPEEFKTPEEYVDDAARWSSEYMKAHPGITSDELLSARQEQFDAHHCRGHGFK